MFVQNIICIATIVRIKIIRINYNGVLLIDVIKSRMKIREREKRGEI